MEHEKQYWFLFCKDSLLLEKQADGTLDIPSGTKSPVPLAQWQIPHEVQSLQGEAYMAVRLDAPVLETERFKMCGLRASYEHLSPSFYRLAGKCAEILYWDANTHFCGVCGGPMRLHTAISKRCENCGKEVWPQLATAIIVLVRRGDEILMVHAKNFRGTFFGLVAGFVETGETLEECVHREVMEETHIAVQNIRYFGSQPWPYPCGLMVGFMADYAGGEIHLQRSELAAGSWFSRNNLPEIPSKLSMARMLIDAWLTEK